MLKVAIKKLPSSFNLPLPQYATPQSAGVDLMAAIDHDIILSPLQHYLVPTGIAIALPKGYEAQVRPRSGLALKNGVTVLNSPGTIDSDYRGEIKVIMINLGQEDIIISHGMRIAQMIISPVMVAKFELNENLEETVRGEGGFGSTGVKEVIS
ncbi:Deoxyuridine 5'-triphosphate nucleotidohydrolase [Rickettsiales bacterium Ac37b]|nr:Deoxyuridine 5'-triphosphate nucleotidohydrolase [Rickettsiales bacterium Ac37b]